jgi:hypothetical protein
MMTDIDLHVGRQEFARAEGCSKALGYRQLGAYGWGRSKDPASVDLHYRRADTLIIDHLVRCSSAIPENVKDA